MAKKNKNKLSKATRNYYLNLLSLFPFLMIIITGLVALRYHGGADYNLTTAGLNGHNWLLTHRTVALILIVLISIHLWLHKHWFRSFFNKKKQSKNHDMNISLFVVFILCVLTALLSWFIFNGKPAADLLREVHNKLGFALIFFFIVHLVNYFKWLITMTKKRFNKNS